MSGRANVLKSDFDHKGAQENVEDSIRPGLLGTAISTIY
jgi:hypothetical protein